MSEAPPTARACATPWPQAGTQQAAIPAAPTRQRASRVHVGQQPHRRGYSPPSSDRPRDASGRFAPSSASPGASCAPKPDDMPDGYDAAVWNMLSPEARAQTSAWAGKQRETVAERDARLKNYEPIDRVLSQQRKDALAMQYGGVDRALEQLFALERLRRARSERVRAALRTAARPQPRRNGGAAAAAAAAIHAAAGHSGHGAAGNRSQGRRPSLLRFRRASRPRAPQ
jgi:hypothetical protein